MIINEALDDDVCSQCGGAANSENSTLCNQCDRRFHLRMRNDLDTGRDCGEVWINEQYLSLEFACFSCLGRPLPGSGSAEPPVGHAH